MIKTLSDFLIFWGPKRPPAPTLAESLILQWHDAQSAVISCAQRKAYWQAEQTRFAKHITNLEAQLAKVQSDTLRFRQLQREIEDETTNQG